MNALLPLMVALPLGAGFVMALIPAGMSKIPKLLSFFISLALVAGSAALFIRGGNYEVGGWSAPAGINLTVDGFSGLLLLTVSVVALAFISHSISFNGHFPESSRFLALSLIMIAGINGVLITGDIFNRFVYVEIAAIASYVLVGFGCGAGEIKAALKYAIIGAVASAFTLLGIALLYVIYGTVTIAHLGSKIAADAPVVISVSVVFLSAAFMFAGFGVKSGTAPFHIWKPDVLQKSSASVSAVISGALIEVTGVYALVRTAYAVFQISGHIGWIMIFFGMFSMTAGVILAIKQDNYRRFLSYHSISQVGYVIAAFGLGGLMLAGNSNPELAALALSGAVFHLVSMSFFNSLLYLNVGTEQYLAAEKDPEKTDGSCPSRRLTSFAWLCGAMSICAVPPSGGFFSKLFIILAFFLSGRIFFALVALIVTLLTLISFFRITKRFEKPAERPVAGDSGRKVPVLMSFALLLLSFLCLFSGLIALPQSRDFFIGRANKVLLNSGESQVQNYNECRQKQIAASMPLRPEVWILKWRGLAGDVSALGFYQNYQGAKHEKPH